MSKHHTTPQEREDVISGLNQHAEAVCLHLFPDGVRQGNTWRIGSIEGEAGNSLSINIEGEKPGFWKDWATEDKGGADFISLWAKCRKTTYFRALREAKAWLEAGGDDAGPQPASAAPTKPKSAPRSTKAEKPFDWETCLRKTDLGTLASMLGARGLSTEFTAWLRFEQKLVGYYGQNVAFPVHDDNGVVVGAHVRDLHRRSWSYVGGCSAHPLIIGNLAAARTVLIFESQWDAFTAYDRLGLKDRTGYAAFVTRGAANGKFVEGKMPTGATLFALKQNDPPDAKGRVPADEWLKAVVRHAGASVYLVKTPEKFKDPNEWACLGNAAKVDFERAIEAAEIVDVPAEEPPTAGSQIKGATAIIIELPDCYYGGLGWFMPNGNGGHVEVTESGMKRFLKALGYRVKAEDGELLSPLEDVVMRLQQQHYLSYAGPLAGYMSGIYKVQDANILVTNSPVFIEPAEGDWPVLRALVENLLGDDPRQLTCFFGWVKVAVASLYSRTRRAGQGLVLAGSAGCGKSLLQNILTIIFGGRSAKPYAFMTGGTAFNRDLFVAEHLMVEDEVPSSDFRSRRNFGTNIKGVTVNETQRLHQKYRDAVTLTPFWRLSISLNDEAENLQVLPPIDDSLADKLILLRVNKHPMPMPTGTDDERKLFWDTLVGELPAFLYWLSTWEIPEDMRDQRYGIRHFHHPAIVQAVDNLAPEARLIALIDDTIFKFGVGIDSPWTGTSRQLEKKLMEECAGQAYEVRRLLSFFTACGVYLARLEQKQPGRITSRVLKGNTIWTINPPEEPTTEGQPNER